MVDDTVGGLLRVLGCIALASLLVGGVLYAPDIRARLLGIGRFLHLVRPAAPSRSGPPIEQIARDLRRLRPQARQHRRGTANAKHRGVVAAYDDLLLDACRALEVPTSLSSLPEGIERESERLRVEFELERAGIAFQMADPGPPKDP
jgi:hypothetical protein